MAESSGESGINEQVCVICRSPFNETTGKAVCVGSKALDTLLQYCAQRNDEALLSYIQSRPSKVLVHSECRRTYTKPGVIRPFVSDDKANDAGKSSKKLRSSSEFFDWHTNCVFCRKFVVAGQALYPYQIDCPLLNILLTFTACERTSRSFFGSNCLQLQ